MSNQSAATQHAEDHHDGNASGEEMDRAGTLGQDLIDIGFTRTLTTEQSKMLSSRHLYSDPMMAVLPAARRVNTKYVRISDLAMESFVLFHREGASGWLTEVKRKGNAATEFRGAPFPSEPRNSHLWVP
jgi:DNA-binding transcriptional LysR family regulator